jgi:hypothetical protein
MAMRQARRTKVETVRRSLRRPSSAALRIFGGGFQMVYVGKWRNILGSEGDGYGCWQKWWFLMRFPRHYSGKVLVKRLEERAMEVRELNDDLKLEVRASV